MVRKIKKNKNEEIISDKVLTVNGECIKCGNCCDLKAPLTYEEYSLLKEKYKDNINKYQEELLNIIEESNKYPDKEIKIILRCPFGKQVGEDFKCELPPEDVPSMCKYYKCDRSVGEINKLLIKEYRKGNIKNYNFDYNIFSTLNDIQLKNVLSQINMDLLVTTKSVRSTGVNYDIKELRKNV